ncbi:MAG: ABC transporter permease [Gemmatimonadaceae bacterium]
MTSSPLHKVVIEPRRPFQLLDWRELTEYRDLLFFFAWRDVSVRYKQSILGWLWAFVQPLSQMLVYSLIFGVLLRIPSDGVPYPLLVLSGIIGWTYFTNVVQQAANSLVAEQGVITKVYFPRLLVPFTPALAYLVDLSIAMAFTLAGVVIFTGRIHLSALSLPLFALMLVVCATSVGTLLAGLNVRYRDVRQGTSLLLQLGMYLTPVIWPLSQLEHKLPTLYWLVGLNPIASVVQGFRYGLLGQAAPPPRMLAASVTATLALALCALWYFHRVEDVVADIV